MIYSKVRSTASAPTVSENRLKGSFNGFYRHPVNRLPVVFRRHDGEIERVILGISAPAAGRADKVAFRIDLSSLTEHSAAVSKARGALYQILADLVPACRIPFCYLVFSRKIGRDN